MKKINLIVVVLLAAPLPLISMKRANSKESLTQEQEPKRQRPADAPKSPTAATEFTPPVLGISRLQRLKVPVIGTENTIPELVNLVEIRDAVGSDSLYNLINEAILEKQGFILARVPTYGADKLHLEYYELENLHKWLFDGNLFPVNSNTISAYNRVTPQRAPICGQILYFIFNTDTNEFEYFSNDYELIKVRPEKLVAIVNALYEDPKKQSELLWRVAKKFSNEKNYAQAKYWLRKAINVNNSNAMNELGYMYQHSLGMARPDYEKAKELFEKGAQLKNASAFNNLASLYDGSGFEKTDFSKAYELYEQSAALGNTAAMQNIANLYERGLGLDKPNLQKAIEWHEKAHALGDKRRETNLINLYYKLWENNPVEENIGVLEKAAGVNGKDAKQFLLQFYYRNKKYVKFFDLARQLASQGDENAMIYLGIAYRTAYGMDKPDFKKAHEWLQRASKNGNAEALTQLAKLEAEADKPDYQKSRELLEQAAARNYTPAMRLLARGYYNGVGLDKPDFKKAVEWLEKAALLEDSLAMEELAVIYDDEKGMEKPDYQKAREWYEKAAAKGRAAAQNNLGVLYESGHGLPAPDYQKAFEYYSLAAAQNNGTSLYLLGQMYEIGHGVPIDYHKAIEFYEKAQKAGDPEAEQKISEIRKKIAEQEKK